MRVVGWMRDKLSHKTNDPFKDFTIGNYCACLSSKSTLDDQHLHVRPRFNSIYEDYPETTFEIDIDTKPEYGDYEDETSTAMSQLFHGFLAIGTLGSEPVSNETPTPTFPIRDEKAEVTQNHLKLINSELEKFFEAEAEEEGSDESFARSSYVSMITPSATLMEEDYGKVALFPLQGYLFGSTIQLPETTPELKKERTSLAEIFHKTKIMDEIYAQPDRKEEIHTKQAHMSAKHLMKKMLKKLYGSSKKPAPGGDAANSVSTKKKLNKILRMFHRKVHPENSLSEKEYTKFDLEIKETMDPQVNLVHQDEDSEEFPPWPNSMEEMQSYENLKQSQHDLSCIDSSGNNEHWIKTDAEYLVLEL
ncbi:Protein LAZY 1 [Euphorbia peplus]|nr:Protein LAZY 1 [Euphorbia peplus]